MSAAGQLRAEGDVCGKWMPRKKAHCGRKPEHRGDCRTAEAVADIRQRKTDRRRGTRLRDDPAAKARWNRSHKFARLGITEGRFNQMLEAQGCACAMCGESFEEGKLIYADHDHTCCPKQRKATAKTCGKCVRGLLCFRCNTALGYIEQYGARAQTYLDRTAAAKGLAA
jgi:hypothetical protein